jgi:hypothetical protein
MSSFGRVRLGGVNAKFGKFKGGKKEEDPVVDCGCDDDDDEEEEEEEDKSSVEGIAFRSIQSKSEA